MAKIEKIYSITLSGEQELVSKMKTVNQLFEESKKRWKELKIETSKGLSAADMAQYKLAIQQAKIETEKLKQETLRLRNESISLTNQNKQNAAAQRQAREEARNSVDAYRKLNDQYKQAKANALNYGASLGTQSREFKSASAEAKRYYDQLRQIEAGVGIHNRNVGNYPANMGAQFSSNIKQYFDDMKGQLASFAVGYIGFQSAMNLAERFKNDAIQADAMGSALAGVSEKTGDLATNQKFLDEISERLGLKIIDNTRNFKTFFAAFTESGGAPAIAREIYSDALEASAKMKLSQEQTNGVMLAFGQIASKGKVQAEELRGQIGERIPGAFGIAAKAMGMTTQELDKAMKDGKVYSSEFLPKFAAELKKTYSVGQEPVKGLQAELNRLDNMITRIGSSKAFIDTFSTFVSVIMLLINVMGKVPFSAWLSIIGLITLAYWANIQAMIVHNATLAVTVVRLGLTNGALIILGATYRVHLILVGLLEGGLKLLIATMNLMGISTARLKGFIIGLNLTLSATPWGVILGLIMAVGAATIAYAETTEKATNKLKEQGKVLKDNIALMRVNSEINKQVSEMVSGQISKIERLTSVIKNNSLSLETRKKALQELIAINPKYLDGLTLENFHTAQGVKILENYKNKLLEVAKAKAASAIYERKAAELFELEFNLADKAKAKLEADKYKNDVFDKRSWYEFASGVGGMIGIGSGDKEDQFNKDLGKIRELKTDLKELGNIVVDNKKKTLDYTMIDGVPTVVTDDDKKKKEKKYSGSKLTGVQKDYLKDLEANRNQALAIIEKQYTDGIIKETEYIEKSLKVNVDYYDKKIAYLKKGNAEERKQEAQAQLDKTKAFREANDKLYALNKKRLDDELKQNENEAQRKRDTVINNPYSTEQEKINAEKTYHSESTTAQLKYNQDMIDLENKLSKSMVEEVNARNRVLQQKLDEENSNNLQSRINNLKADVSDVDKVKDQVDNQNEINAAVAKRNILGDKRLDQQRKENELSLINAQLSLNNTNAELGAVISKITLFEQEISKRKLTNDELREYNRLLRERALLEGKKADGEVVVGNAQGKSKTSGNGTPGYGMSGLANAVTKGALGKDGKMSIDGVDVSEAAAYAIAQGFNMAEQAMNNYFDAERQRIEQSKQLAYQRIDMETEQLKRYAQTNGEREAIDKQAAAKKKKADKEAGEQLKKTKKSEAKIAFLMELANIWSTVWQLGPIAGPIMGGIFTALAGVKYAMTIGNINKTQYKRGGLFGLGGRLDGPSHSSGGMPVYNPVTGEQVAEMEGKEGIINANSMSDSNKYTVSGTPSQIASKINSIGGGVDWFGGATISKFKSGGLFNWNRTQPPVFNSQIQKFEEADKQFETNDRMDRAERMIEALAKEQSKKVIVSSKEISKSQKENVKQTEIGTL